MRLHKPTSARRTGFTMVEMMVVIAILAVLMALITGAVMMAVGKGPELQTRHELQGLQASIATFQKENDVDYLPSQIVLHEQISNYNTNNPVERDSLIYLKRVFGRQMGETGTVNWDGAATPGPHTLEGHECLVFFLGGIPDATSGACLGFSDNPRNPAQSSGTRRGPYFNFQSNRLKPSTRNATFLVYHDPNDMPYAYFSTYGKANNYNKYSANDCSPVSGGPYKTSANAYANPSSFQIISAGADGQFGPGGLWNPPNTPPDKRFKDDMANFHDKLLGVP